MSALMAQAQHKGSVETRALMQEFSRTKSATAALRVMEGQLAVQQDAKGGVTVRALAKLAPGVEGREIEKQGIKVTSQVADIVSLRLPLEGLFLLEQNPLVLQYSVAHKAVGHCDNSRLDTHADSVQAGIGLEQPFKGDGVLVGICDWGFDYQHPNINSEAEQRVVAAWDQFKTAGPAPEGFDYGTVYRGYDELIAAKVDTSNIYQYNSHGTHCAGIIGGRGTKAEGNSQSKYIGIAPHVQYLFGSWMLDEASWMDQVAWMKGMAQQEQKRLVISNSWGMYSFSTLDGTSLASQALNHYSDSGIVFVTSAGNNGNTNYHISKTFNSQTDTLRSFVTYYPDEGGQMLICWGTEGKPFSIGFGLSTGTTGTVTRSPFFSTEDNIDYEEGYVVADGDTVKYSVMTESTNLCNHRPHILLKVAKSSLRLRMYLASVEGSTVHAWNVNYVPGHESNVGMDFTKSGVGGYTDGDHFYGIGEPACAEQSIAVAAHKYGRWQNDTVWKPADIAGFSSFGPTMDGRVKPDISAPGVSVISSVSSWDPEDRDFKAAVNYNGRSYKWAEMSGTSMSGPAVAGTVALMLQANPRLSVAQIKEVIGNTAINDQYTGNLRDNDSVSIRWGHGKINAYRCVNGAIDKLDIDEVVALNAPLQVYPNPTTDRLTVLTFTNMECLVEVYAIQGSKVMQQRVEGGEACLDVQGLEKGIYVVRCQDRSGIRTAKFVKL